MGLSKKVFIYNPYKLEVPHYIIKYSSLEIKDNFIVLENSVKIFIEIVESINVK